MKRLLTIVLLAMVAMPLTWAQDASSGEHVRCLTDEKEAERRANNPNMPSIQDFESWMAQKIEERRANPDARQATYRVPYVLHVIHNGEAIGTGTNLSQAILDEQMEQINEDFRYENADNVNTPADFVDVAGSLDIEFVPAVVDPDGNIMPEPGIDRVDRNDEGWPAPPFGTGFADATIKPATIWDPTLYMNVWIADIGGVLGYAQFPEAPSLPGIGTGNGGETTDGVFILTGSVGGLDIPGTVAGYDLGRTLTHELGHWLGCRHIWGDSDGTDYCDDTPTASGPNFTGEPCTYPGPNSATDPAPDFPDMFMNFMDYSDDPCFNLFTEDQVERMVVVLENSIRRNELLTSPVWQFPSQDTIIAGIDQDDNGGCAPVVVNFTDDSFLGDDADPITSWEWDFDVDGLGGASPSTFSGETPPAVTFSTAGVYTISLTIDNGTYTNSATVTVTVEGVSELDVAMGFEAGIPVSWEDVNWVETGDAGSASANSVFQDNYSNSGRVSAFLTTPSLNFDNGSDVYELTFDVAHANFSLTGLGADEGMAVAVSSDCGETWDEVWRKLDSDDPPFYTSQSTSSTWLPDAGEWRTEEIDLTAYAGSGNLRIRFEGVSDFGNDTYLDNININGITIDPNSIEAGFEADPTEGCQGLEVNFTDVSTSGSTTTITSWEWDFDADGLGGVTPSTYSGENPPTVTYGMGGVYTVTLTASDGTISSIGSGTITVEGSVAPPLLEDFEAGLPGSWVNFDFETAPVGFSSIGSLFQDNFNNADASSAFFTSPSIDLSGPADEATITFDVAHTFYGPFGPEDEGLAVAYSLDCGETWTEIYRKLDSDPDPFYTVPGGSSGAYVPASDDEWRAEEIDIFSLVGNAGVKFRFEGVSAFGNNTYIDNINISTRVVDANTIEAEFEASTDKICAGQTVSFTDLSLVGADITGATWDWDFDADGVGSADPATFTGETPPAVAFNAAGIYTVELTVSGTGTAGPVEDMFSLNIEVEGTNPLPIAEDFEGGTFPPAGWTNESDIAPFTAGPVGFGSSTSAFANNFDNDGLRADLGLPSLDFSAVGRAELTFDVASTYFAGLFGNLYDTLAVSYSLDCGASWTEIWRKVDGDAINPLNTVGPEGGAWAPASDDDWRNEAIDVTFLQGNDNVKIRFENRGGFGNNLFLDNINIDAELVEPDEVFAYFTFDGGGCLGADVNFTDLSTAGANTEITSWEWDFDASGVGGADPASFSGETPGAVTFNTPGDYEVVLTVSDGSVSDDYSVTISVGGSEDLTFTENFASSTFPPVGWTNILWEQAAPSSDDLLGSLFANNWGVPGLETEAWTPALDMSWYDQVEMTFDVAHARFSPNENEGVIIGGSEDCGGSFTEVFSKFDFDADPLYTETDFVDDGGFVPEASDWREEAVDLSQFNNSNSVLVQIKSIGDFGNNTYVDDIKIEGWLFNPTELAATVSGGNDVELTWTDNSGKESNYRVERWNPTTSTWNVLAMLDADSESYMDSNVDIGDYSYRVCAYNEKAEACSGEVDVTIEPVLAIEGLVAILVESVGTTIELFWTDASTTETGFFVKRSLDGVNFTVINDLTPNQEYYNDEFLMETTTYYYQICVYNGEDTIESNIAVETTNINAPTNLQVTADFIDLALTWTDNSIVEDGFQIKRSETAGGPYSTVTVVTENITAYTDFTLEELTTYYYIVCAYNDVDTRCSAEASGTTDQVNSVFDDLDRAISVYPNPASSFVDLELSGVRGDISVRVFNNLGELMYNEMVSGGTLHRIGVEDFASGVYMIHLDTEEGFTTKKLVVE